MTSNRILGVSALSALTLALVGGAGAAQAATPNSGHLGNIEFASLASHSSGNVLASADLLNHDHLHDHDSSNVAAMATNLTGKFNV